MAGENQCCHLEFGYQQDPTSGLVCTHDFQKGTQRSSIPTDYGREREIQLSQRLQQDGSFPTGIYTHISVRTTVLKNAQFFVSQVCQLSRHSLLLGTDTVSSSGYSMLTSSTPVFQGRLFKALYMCKYERSWTSPTVNENFGNC